MSEESETDSLKMQSQPSLILWGGRLYAVCKINGCSIQRLQFLVVRHNFWLSIFGTTLLNWWKYCTLKLKSVWDFAWFMVVNCIIIFGCPTFLWLQQTTVISHAASGCNARRPGMERRVSSRAKYLDSTKLLSNQWGDAEQRHIQVMCYRVWEQFGFGSGSSWACSIP